MAKTPDETPDEQPVRITVRKHGNEDYRVHFSLGDVSDYATGIAREQTYYSERGYYSAEEAVSSLEGLLKKLTNGRFV